jgi:hypothetical protein
MHRFCAGLSVIAALAIPGIAAAGQPHDGDPTCVATDTENLDPSATAPAWYVPGVTGPCSAPGDEPLVLRTATWVYFAHCGGDCDAWRTTPDNADYSANDCQASLGTCGTKIIGDPDWFYNSCVGRGLTASQVATNIRYWADRARANGSNWRVYTFTETGGYPYSCQFSVVAL